MESSMRTKGLAILAAALGMLVCAPANAFWFDVDTVPPIKGNDTGGIIAYDLYRQGADVKAIAVNHCARWGKGVKLLATDAQYGGYISFACVWVHPGYDHPLRVAY